jgi:hypothetical protein
MNKFLDAIDDNDIKTVKSYIKDKTCDIALDDNYAIRQAAINGCLEIVELLLNDPRVDPSVRLNEAILNSYEYCDELSSFNISMLLYNNEKVQEKLKENQPEIYNALSIKNKISKNIHNF